MKVKDLIEKLQRHDPNKIVYIYSNEDFADAYGVVDKKKATEDLYCKGCSFSEWNKCAPDADYIVIHDNMYIKEE